MNINEKINLTINSHITKNCEKLFIEDIQKVEVKECSKENYNKYIEEELNDNDLYLSCNVVNEKIII